MKVGKKGGLDNDWLAAVHLMRLVGFKGHFFQREQRRAWQDKEGNTKEAAPVYTA